MAAPIVGLHADIRTGGGLLGNFGAVIMGKPKGGFCLRYLYIFARVDGRAVIIKNILQ